MESKTMTTIRMTVCSMVALAGMCGINSSASAQGLVGFYVYPDMYGRGLVIGSFIPGTSASMLNMQGQLMPGDIITRYNGQRVYSAAQIRQISRYNGGGKMDFLTPFNQPFYHYVDAGNPVCAHPGPGMAAAHAAPSLRFRKGSSRPGGNQGGGFRPGSGGPGRHGGPDRPGPGRPGPGRPW